ncbi:MAG: hypothetical protein ACE5HE_13785 [Phycisphaerae bacterium]
MAEHKQARIFLLAASAVLIPLLYGCQGQVSLLNPSFVNSFIGGQFPLTPGPGAAFVLVRALNETGDTAEFIITVEREELVLDDAGNPLFNDAGEPVTETKRETVRLNTAAVAPANDLGVLFPCSPSPVNVVGLGENLLETDAALFIGGQGGGGTQGTGVSAAGLNPLVREEGNFDCGDTIIFHAFVRGGIVGGTVQLQSLVLEDTNQPETFTGPDTFINLADFLASQARGDD